MLRAMTPGSGSSVLAGDGQMGGTASVNLALSAAEEVYCIPEDQRGWLWDAMTTFFGG